MSKLTGLSPWRAAALLMTAVITCGCMATTPTRAADTAGVLLARVEAKYRAATSLSATMLTTTVQGSDQEIESVALQLRRPNLLRFRMTAPQKMSLMSDGKSVYTLTPANQYLHESVEDGLAKGEKIGGLPISLFLGHDSYGIGNLSDAGAEKRYAGKQTVAGVTYDVVTVTRKAPAAHTLQIFIGPDGLIGRSTIQDGTMKQTSDWKEQKLNALPLTVSFAVALPRGATPLKQAPDEDYLAKMVAVGKPAPVFALPTPSGGTVSLTDSIAEHKAVLVNFWFYG